jgi:hypothetical protein
MVRASKLSEMKSLHSKIRRWPRKSAGAGYPVRRWTKREDALLGTMPDARLAKRLHRSVSAIGARRHLKRISLRRIWTPAEDKLLGARPDSQIAARLKLSTSSVAERRRRVGIASFERQQRAQIAAKLAAMSGQKLARLLRVSHRLFGRARRDERPTITRWTPAEDRLLGKWPDERVARFLGRTPKAVEARRLKRHILYAKPGRRWSPEEDRRLDPATAKLPLAQWTRQLARELGRSVYSVSNRRRVKHGALQKIRPWTKRELRLLGTRPDPEIARLLDRKCGTVQVLRGVRGIASWRERNKFKWTAAKDRLLGTKSDEALGKRFGTHRKSVEARRRALGIPAGISRPWTQEEERLVGTMRDEEVARRIGRSAKSVLHRRCALGLPQPKRW